MLKATLLAAAAALALAVSVATVTVTASPPLTQTYADFPTAYYPANLSTRPRLLLTPTELARIRAVYTHSPSTQIPALDCFSRELSKLLQYTSASQDWRADSGWPAATLALAYLVTNNSAYADKAIATYLGSAKPSAGSQHTNVHFILAYDWLHAYPGFTAALKKSLRTSFIAFSDANVALDEASSWTAHDSDRNAAVTAGHLLAGLAMLGDDDAAAKTLLRRGWTGWKFGLNTNADLPTVPLATVHFKASLETGVPLPGWDYGMMSDYRVVSWVWAVLDQLGVIDAEFAALKPFWGNAIRSFLHYVDPLQTHYHIVGDTQADNTIANVPYVLSHFTDAVFWGEKYGQTTEAAVGRFFLSNLPITSPRQEGDPLRWLFHAWLPSAPQTNPAGALPRYWSSSAPARDNMAFAAFRSAWRSTDNSPASPMQVTWGLFSATGYYSQDHINNAAGTFNIWRNGDYLLQDPYGYGANEAGPVYNSLGIKNDANGYANDHAGYLLDRKVGGPIVYWSQLPGASVRRSRARDDDVMYVALNGDSNYNVLLNEWRTCVGACRQPVKTYTRHFVFDGVSNDVAFVVDRVQMASPVTTTLRFRTQNAATAPSVVDAATATIKIPSAKNGYRTLVRVLKSPAKPSWVVMKEKTAWGGTVPSYQMPASEFGYQINATFGKACATSLVTALHFGKATAGVTQLASAAAVTSSTVPGGVLGGCALSFCVVFGPTEAFFPDTFSFSVGSSTPATARVFVGDLDSSTCYNVTGSASGIIATRVWPLPNDNSMMFNVSVAGAQTFVVQADRDACVAAGTESPTMAPVGSAPTPPTMSPAAQCFMPTKRPTIRPTSPTRKPTNAPTKKPTKAPTKRPSTKAPTKRPSTKVPTRRPTLGGRL